MGHVARAFSLDDERTIPEPNTGCFLWLGCADLPNGYGTLKINKICKRAHRVSFETFKGPIPDNKWVLHICDNKLCVNPDHLYLGDRQDNVNDAVRRNRLKPRMGQNNGRARLTDEQALEIMNSADNQFVLAARYGVSQASISWIKTGKRKQADQPSKRRERV